MATIGTFTEKDGKLIGKIQTLSINASLAFLPNQKSPARMPRLTGCSQGERIMRSEVLCGAVRCRPSFSPRFAMVALCIIPRAGGSGGASLALHPP